MFGTTVATRIFVDEGEGYRSTNEDGLNNEMVAAWGTAKYWKMTFSEKKDRNIKFEISKLGNLGNVYIEKDARITKVQRENVKKVMFFGDQNVFQVKLHITKGISQTFTAYPFGICDSLNLSCIANVAGGGGNLYLIDR